MKGEAVFSKEEMEAAFPPKQQFFKDGETREIVIIDREITDAVGKESGKPYKRIDWKLADAKTGETYDLKFDFNFTNAMREHKDTMKFETSTFKVTPTKTGERKGFDVFDYTIEYTGESGSVVTAPEPENVPFN